jgi:SAM-dependent methyltransferase
MTKNDELPSPQTHASPYIFHAIGLERLITSVSIYARKQMFKSLMDRYNPSEDVSILDVGVTNDRRADANFFEKWYPYPNRIVAVGTEDALFLESEFAGLKFIKIAGGPLPFPDRSFDLVVSFAVLEHVGSEENQRKFVAELCRVGKSVCFTTPNRWFPLEFHTVVPFLHWLPPGTFRAILKLIGKKFMSLEENLNLLGEQDVLKLLPPGCAVETSHAKLVGLVSNLVFFVEPPDSTRNEPLKE